jgi:hypothetical protein
MAGREVLVLKIGVRVPVPEPRKIKSKGFYRAALPRCRVVFACAGRSSKATLRGPGIIES